MRLPLRVQPFDASTFDLLRRMYNGDTVRGQEHEHRWVAHVHHAFKR
jgi:hypothetical protein